MTDIKNRDNILEAIDQLRRRKARPDIHRICNFMTRRFAVDSKDTKADLVRCVENDIVLKVEYKGNISYRNAAKKSYGHIKHIKKDAHSPIDIKTAENRKLFPGIVTTAVADLFLEDSDYLDFGVPHTELVRKILSQHSPKFNKKTITDLLQREVENGGLIKMENGNFSLGPSQQNESEQGLEMLEDNNDIKDISQDSSEKMDYDEYLNMNTSNDNSTTKIRKKPGPKPGKRKNEMEKLRSVEATSSVRLGGRRKRAKKVFDPSDNNLPRLNRKRGRPLGSLNKSTLEKQSVLSPNSRQYGITYPGNNLSTSPEVPGSRPTSRASSVGTSPRENVVGVCSVCHTQGKKGPCDKMIGCRECSNKAHLSCLNSEDGILRMYPDHTWQCPHCKTCVVCYETSDAGFLTVCSICADAYHSFCHEPKISLDKTKIGCKWVCNNCQMEPLLTDIKPKMEIKTELEVKNEDIKSSNVSSDRSSPSPSNSNMSSPYIHSPPGSPTPPTLSPQANHRDSGHNSTNHNSSILGARSQMNENMNFRYFNAINTSDSQSLKEFETDDFDPSIPDASNWTHDDVYNYFVQYFPEEAIVFKEQEIDGHSLLLMKRVDVLTSLNLKLGPALKIYRHVLKLQVRRDDHKLYWL